MDEKLKQALDALEFAEGAILDAIFEEDGLDKDTAIAVLQIISSVLLENNIKSAFLEAQKQEAI